MTGALLLDPEVQQRVYVGPASFLPCNTGCQEREIPAHPAPWDPEPAEYSWSETEAAASPWTGGRRLGGRCQGTWVTITINRLIMRSPPAHSEMLRSSSQV